MVHQHKKKSAELNPFYQGKLATLHAHRQRRPYSTWPRKEGMWLKIELEWQVKLLREQYTVTELRSIIFIRRG